MFSIEALIVTHVDTATSISTQLFKAELQLEAFFNL